MIWNVMGSTKFSLKTLHVFTAKVEALSGVIVLYVIHPKLQNKENIRKTSYAMEPQDSPSVPTNVFDLRTKRS